MLPKMPIASVSENECTETRTAAYFAYAEGVVYEVVLASRFTQKSTSVVCRQTRKFAPGSLGTRINELGQSVDGVKPVLTKSSFNGLDMLVATTDSSVRHLIADVSGNQRWVEVAAHFYADAKPDLEKFLSSVKFDGTSGIEIGNGSKVMLGDPLVAASSPVPDPPKDARTIPYRVVSKSRPAYPESGGGRSGRVTLKMEFLPNGSVGEITQRQRLGFGFDDEARNAARRIAFLPARVNGVAVSVNVLIDYGFTTK